MRNMKLIWLNAFFVQIFSLHAFLNIFKMHKIAFVIRFDNLFSDKYKPQINRYKIKP